MYPIRNTEHRQGTLFEHLEGFNRNFPNCSFLSSFVLVRFVLDFSSLDRSTMISSRKTLIALSVFFTLALAQEGITKKKANVGILSISDSSK
jgi:hypothetical protein